MIFHHGPAIKDAEKAIAFSEKSFKLDYRKAHWLYAAATDRFLTKHGKKQKFGTQFFKKKPRSKWVLRPIDPKTTDKERAQFNVPSLKKIKETLEQMNKSERMSK